MALHWNGETAATGALLACYVVAAAVFLLRHKSETTPSLRPRLQQAVFVTTCLTIVASIAESTAQAVFLGGLSKEVVDSLCADLFFILVWIILFLGLYDLPGSPSYPHFIAWLLSLVLRGAQLADRVDTFRPHFGRKGKAVVALLCVQVGAICITMVAGALCRCLPTQRPETGNAEEIQPLLEGAETEEAKKDDKKKKDDENEIERKAIRSRPYRQYILSYRIYLPYMFPSNLKQRLATIAMFVCSGATRVVNVVRPLLLGTVVNHISRDHVPWNYILAYIMLYFLSSGIGIPLAEDWLNIIVTNEQKLALNRAAYNHVMNLSADFHDSKQSAKIWQSMQQARSVVSLFHNVAFEVIPSTVDLIAALIVLWNVFGLYMGLLVATTIILFLWITVKALSPRSELQRDYRDAWIDEWHQLVESSSNWYTSSQFNQIDHEKGQYRDKAQKTQDLFLVKIRYNYANRAAKHVVLLLAFLGAASLAAVEIGRGEQEIGAFVVLTTYWAQMQGPLNQVVNEINQVVEKFIDAEKLMVLLEKEPSIQDDKDAKPYSFSGGAVEFQDVHFSYDGKRKATEATSFSSAAGTTTALVGETGGGKSTLLKLLFRFYDPEKGQVMIDGQDIKHVQFETLRSHIGMVPQDPAVFNATVSDNVKYPDLVATQEQVEEACKAASLHDKIMTFPNGYDEKVGERGSRLSGGELQRLAIARAIIKKPDILLLDEATSAVDSVTEASIQASLERLCAGKTSFVIAHRLSTILKADQILVIESGKVVESGSHAELLKKKGAYHKLWSSQLKLQDEREQEARARSKSPEKKGQLTLTNDLQIDEAETKQLRKVVSQTDAEPSQTSEQQQAPPSKELKVEATTKRPPLTSPDGRGRTSVKDMVSTFGRRMSTSKSGRRGSKDAADAASSPTRSRLKPNALPFVPSKQRDQTDGTADDESPIEPEPRPEATATSSPQRRSRSEPGAAASDTEESKSESSNSHEDPATRYSRIPKRNQ